MQQSNRDTGRNVGAVILIIVGVVFMLGQFFSVNVWSIFGGLFGDSWPFGMIIVSGLFVLAYAYLGGKNAVPAAIPGAIVTGTGVILLFQDITGQWKTWSYVWGLYPVFVGLALMFMGWRTQNPAQSSAGRKAVMIGLILTAVFGLFMEAIFNDSFGQIFDFGVNYIVPIALICGGVLLLMRRPSPSIEGKAKNDVIVSNGKPKRSENGAAITPDLQRRIDEALAEDDPKL